MPRALWHTASMRLSVNTYIPRKSAIHAADARVKILLLLGYSITLFLVDAWLGLLLCGVVFLAVFVASRLPPFKMFSLMAPLGVIAAFTILFNGFSLDVASASLAGPPFLPSGSPSPVFSVLAPVPILGSFGFVPAGFARGCFFAVRILLLLAASLVVSYTTTSTALTDAFAGFLRPLGRLRIPTDDIATVFSLALRFVPVTAEEFGRVHDAQWARGAAFAEGSLWNRLRAWQTVLIPLFVGLFRRADALAVAMDARCYGAPGIRRTSLADRRFTAQSAFVLVAGLALCVMLAVGT